MTNAFIGKAAAPSDAELAAVLGSALKLWDRVRLELGLAGEWNSYSKKAGWSMRLKSGKRNIVYLLPGEGGFDAAFILGGRAVEEAKRQGLAARLEGAKKWPEGTDVRFPVRREEDVTALEKLARIKMAH